MNDNHVKQSPMLTLPSLGGGSHSTLVRKASTAYDPGTPGTVVSTANAPISHGMPFYRGNGNYGTYAEFQSNGTVVLCQNLWGEWKYNLSSAWDLSTASYQNGSGRYWTICQYHDGAPTSYKTNGRVMRFDYINDKAYYYNGSGETKVIQSWGTYTQTSPSVLSSSSSFSGGGAYGTLTSYVKKSGGGLAILNVYQSGKKMWIRNYSNDTTSTVSSYTEYDWSSDITNLQTLFNATLSANGTTLSIWYRTTTSGVYQVAKWTLSTAFDLTTIGSVSFPGAGNYSSLINQTGFSFVNASWGSRAIAMDMYGALKSYSFGTDGDLSTVTLNGSINRTNNMGYHNGSSYGVWFDDGKKIIDQGYSSSHYVYDSTSNPYGWKFHDMDPPNRSSNHTQLNTATTNEGQTFSDGRFNGNKSKLYGIFYGSTYTLKVRNLTTPGDITTLNSSPSSQVTFTGWTGSYSNVAGWYDKANNKYHMAAWTNNGSYYIFDLDSSGEFTGTYNTTPTGFTSGDFHNMKMLTPLSYNGKYFCYFDTNNSGTMLCEIIFLDYPFEPARGYTSVTNFNPLYNLPNGSTVNTTWWDRMYVASGRIFFTNYGTNSAINMVYDITIDGVAPDDLT